ncbi:MAG: hypothetical protein IPL29_16120 [Propionivibrio sp.]|nr:hypothetical protein [Propionivibrio sp.]
MAVIVPDGVLFGPSNAHVDIRKKLIEERTAWTELSPCHRRIPSLRRRCPPPSSSSRRGIDREHSGSMTWSMTATPGRQAAEG